MGIRGKERADTPGNSADWEKDEIVSEKPLLNPVRGRQTDNSFVWRLNRTAVLGLLSLKSLQSKTSTFLKATCLAKL